MRMTSTRKKVIDCILHCTEGCDRYSPTTDDVSRLTGIQRANARRTLLELESYGVVERVEVASYYSVSRGIDIKRKCTGWNVTGKKPEPIERLKLSQDDVDKLINKIFGG